MHGAGVVSVGVVKERVERRQLVLYDLNETSPLNSSARGYCKRCKIFKIINQVCE